MNIKDEIRKSGFRQWQVAEKIGLSEFTLSRYLRRPERMPREWQERIKTALSDLKKGAR